MGLTINALKAELGFMRLVVVSNRLPFTVSFKDGAPQFKPSAGGLTTGLWSYLDRKSLDGAQRPDFLWMGWPGASVPPEHESAVRTYGGQQFKSSPVFLPEESMDRFYLGFCNKTIWPLFHYFPMLTALRGGQLAGIPERQPRLRRGGGERPAPGRRGVDSRLPPDAIAETVREKFPEMPIGFFLHIPFPSWEVFRMLPRRGARKSSKDCSVPA